MTKSDLETILLKIRNRCGLEEQTKITYYWDEEKRIVFKIFFDSLYLPEELRVGEDNIQNMFLTQNVYAYKDDFQILELNQDEGFIKILPDDQDFVVIDSYKAAKQTDEESKKDKEKEEAVKLAGKRLNEDYALMKGYLLQEDEDKATEKSLLKGDDAIANAKKAQTPKSKEPVAIHAYVAVINNPIQSGAGKTTKDSLVKALKSLLANLPTDGKAKVFIGIPNTPSDNQLNSYHTYSIACVNDAVLEATGKAVGGAYILCSQNSKSAEQVLKESEVLDVTYLTDEKVAKDLLKKVNAQQLLSAPIAKNVNNGIVQDTTTLQEIENIAFNKIISKYRDMVQTYGGVRKDPSQKTFIATKSSKAKKESETKETTPKTTSTIGNTPDRKAKQDVGKTKETKNWDKAKENLAAEIKSNPNVDAAIKLLCDLYSDSADGEDKRVYEERRKAYGEAWAVLGPLGRPLTNFYDRLKARCDNFVSQTLLAALSKGVATAQERAADELTGQEANAGTIGNASSVVMNKDTNQASKTANVSLTYKGSKKGEKPSKDTSERIADYTNDFPVFCAYWENSLKKINPNGQFNSAFEELLSKIDVNGVRDAKDIAETGAAEASAKPENANSEGKDSQESDEANSQENDEAATSENDEVANQDTDEAADTTNDEAASSDGDE